MFKKLTVSVILGVSLMSSFMLWAQNTEESEGTQLVVEQQLSISAHDAGEGKFLAQVSAKQDAAKHESAAVIEEDVARPLITGLGFLVFGLMYFVLRSSRQRVK